jgi:hypothetical protein
VQQLVVRWPRQNRRLDRGRFDVIVDERIRGTVEAGNDISTPLYPGEHVVRVGNQISQDTFVGSPRLTITVEPDRECRVRVQTAGTSWLRRLDQPEALLRLVEEVDGVDAQITQLPDPKPWLWIRRNLFTRGLIDHPSPWRTWQAAVAVFLSLYGSWIVVLLSLGRTPRSAVSWVWMVLELIVCVHTFASLIVIVCIRHRRHDTARAPARNPTSDG